MKYPHFYKQIPPIKLYDPMSDFLGAFENGNIHMTYLECVKLTGHSCPTVAGAFLLAREGLNALYEEETPERGSIKVEMRASKIEGTTGVTAAVLSYITGASDVGGFKGLNGCFSRDNLLFFDANIKEDVRLTRLDTQESVLLTYDPSKIEKEAAMMPLMQKSLQNLASKEEKEHFKRLWQARVEKILFCDETLITIKKENY